MEIIKYLLSSAVVGGLIVSFLKSYIDRQLSAALQEKNERQKKEVEYKTLVTEYEHATGRVIFWLHNGAKKMDIEQKYFNGEFEQAYQDFQSAEKAKKKFEQAVFAQQKY